MYRDIDENIRVFENMFTDCGDLVKRKIPVSSTYIYVLYFDGMADRAVVENRVLDTFMLEIRKTPPNNFKDLTTALINGGLTTADFREEAGFENAAVAVMSGETLLIIDGFDKAIIISTKNYPVREVGKPDTEGSIEGPKEAFTENFRDQTALIRRRIRDTNLKIKQLKAGRRSQTDIALIYLEDVCRPEILQEALRRIESIDIDAILDSGYLSQLINENVTSFFPLMQLTERPDKAAAEILEGRIVIAVDTSPFVIILPAVLPSFYQTGEDYYQNWQAASLIRIIRYIASVLALTLPALYVCLALYNPSMLPAELLLKMSFAREGVPISGIAEIYLMELAFEALREAGIRMPSSIGSTLGIVGGIIIGQAAVDAGIVSPIVVIVVSLTGICSFAIPQIALGSAYRLSKYFLLTAASFFGFLGFWAALITLLIHISSLKSFGIPYLYPFAGGDIEGDEGMRDTFFRFPIRFMKKRPIFSTDKQKIRMKSE